MYAVAVLACFAAVVAVSAALSIASVLLLEPPAAAVDSVQVLLMFACLAAVSGSAVLF